MKFYVVEVVLVFDYFYLFDIIYWDFKLENLFLGVDGYVKVIDFGFVKYVFDIIWIFCGILDYCECFDF